VILLYTCSMTWRVPPYDQAIAELEPYVQATWKPIGVIVAGSIVRGEGGPTSDLDVVVLHEEPWRLREQRWFAGVPTELFVNPPGRVRQAFADEHAEGWPSMAHMFVTGEVLDLPGPPHPVVAELIREAREWLARPVALSPAQLAAQRYGAVDMLDNARDVIDDDPAAAQLFLASTVTQIIACAFLGRGLFQPRRKRAIAALSEIDPAAGDLIRRWATQSGRDALATVEQLARHVIGVDTFFAWASDRDPVIAPREAIPQGT
jgi:predicted nucleotidyltransferase